MRKVSKEVNKENIPIFIYIILIIGAILGFTYGSSFIIEIENVLLKVAMLMIWTIEGAFMALFGIYIMLQAIEEIKEIKKKKTQKRRKVK